jgi:signal transduction histidine kinase
MKLIAKTGLYYLLLSLILFVAGGVLFYFFMNKILDEEINEQLSIEKEKLVTYIKEKNELPPASPLTDGMLSFAPVNDLVQEEFRDTLILSPLKDEMLPYRRILFPARIKEQNYAISIFKPVFEKDDLMDTILKSLGIIGLVLLLIIFLAGRWLSTRLWKPFYNTLGTLRKYDMNKNEPLSLTATSTEEFRQLNDEVKRMTDKINDQYQNLKAFSENASHEIQTPLAIMQNKLEEIIQSENLPQQEMKTVQEVYESVNRLSKLNQSLLLLAKIENRQFPDEQFIDLKELMGAKLTDHEEMIRFKNISIEKNMKESLPVKMNPQLADILLSNIIGNAIKHNSNGGVIIITTTTGSFSVSNSGKALSQPTERFFERFSKADASTDSSGLGLAIVKQICGIYGFRISYTYSDALHIVTAHT